MTIIYIILEPEEIELKQYVSIDEDDTPPVSSEQIIIFKGKPNYGGPYRHTLVTFKDNENQSDLPELAVMRISFSRDPIETIGTCSFLRADSDRADGTDEPDQLFSEISLSQEQFNSLWNLVSNKSVATTASISIRAPETDISGHEAIFNIDESECWLITDVYFSTKVPNRE